MHTWSADTLLPGCPASVHAAVWELVTGLWAVTAADVVACDEGSLLVHGVRVDGQTDCWLTWELASAGPSLTRVRLLHDDADPGAALPQPELDEVLGRLLVTVIAGRTREEST
jgi:hypothetical protein